MFNKKDFLKILYFSGCLSVSTENLLNMSRQMHPIKPKGLSLGLAFQFFEYLGFGFGFRYFANLLQISN
jgi:hypothetical protein